MACGRGEPDLPRRTAFLMGTLVEITVADAPSQNNQEAITQAFAEMARIENLMSDQRPDSDVSRLNHESGGAWVTISPETLEVIQRSLYWGERSSGALDITIGPVVELWNFDEETQKIPDTSQLSMATALVDYKTIEMKEGKVRLANPGMALHLGAIGKGYAVDRAVDILKKAGIQNALVNAGGDLMVIGSRGHQHPWRVGLQHPRKPEAMLASMTLSGKAIATSGDYQRYFIRDDIRYHHILNPDSGMPARDITSATVIADNVMDADALATAIFVLGAEKGMKLIESLAGVEGMILTEAGPPQFSEGFRSGTHFEMENVENNISQ